MLNFLIPVLVGVAVVGVAAAGYAAIKLTGLGQRIVEAYHEKILKEKKVPDELKEPILAEIKKKKKNTVKASVWFEDETTIDMEISTEGIEDEIEDYVEGELISLID